jgi:D-3-phosphoglycerate dehydrogenase
MVPNEIIKILVCDPIHIDGIRLLEKAGFQVDQRVSITPSELQIIVKHYDAIVVRSRTKVTQDVLKSSDRLKIVARAGVGLDNIDIESAKKRGVEILSSPEAPSNAVAELVIGFMFSLARNIPRADATMKRGEWIKRELTGFELKGKTFGIIGFGRIGFELAKKAKIMGMKVLTYDIIIEKLMKFVEEAGAISVSLKDLLQESDFISIHVPLLPQTRHLIDERQIAMMKDGAYLINAARGGIVDESALKKALMEGKLAGAALDVFENEPPDDASLLGLENLIASPHIGAATVEAQIANSTIISEKLIKFFS